MAEIDRPKPALTEQPRYWPWPVIVGLTILFTVVFAVGGVLIEVTAWVLGLGLFILLCFAFYAVVRWLFRLPDW